ncbi:SRPBCC family protein [Nocardia sp. NBC_01327]|uniref:SRPBCC family protein n=1 Tax=Nocardia sp. NBC_01327 TaxID=2903593 RepID=UPI002E132911|nr:SRPBCC family protein [Nocardia sp. NBC_01327]
MREVLIDVAPEQVWELVSDFGAGPQRMAPGFVTDSHLTGEDTREVAFLGGTIVQERRITLDDEARRLVYSVYDGTTPPEHDNSVLQVFAREDGSTRLVWSRDILPDGLAGQYTATMEQGLALFKKVLESA